MHANIHGEFFVKRFEQVVLTVATGPWNRECIMAFADAYRAEVGAIYGTSWTDIVILRGESLLVPAAEFLLAEKLQVVAPQGFSRIAVVIGQSQVQYTTREQFRRIYTGVAQQCEFFSAPEDALDWANKFVAVAPATREAVLSLSAESGVMTAI